MSYNELLSDFYADLTEPVLRSGGEIYQYVGDEVVVSWSVKRGISNANCIKCFFDINKIIERETSNYIEKYGLVPEFKAGLHYGNVTMGEIGIIKRDISFSGDVLNTTSRIQSTCNQYNEKLLVSDELLEMLEHSYKTKSLGELDLRGKSVKIKVSAVRE